MIKILFCIFEVTCGKVKVVLSIVAILSTWENFIFAILSALTLDLAFSARQCDKIYLYYKAQFCLCFCFNSSETDRGTNIRFKTIDHHLVMSIIGGS